MVSLWDSNFYVTVCHVCKVHDANATVGTEGGSTLKTCSKCQLISYCGVAHQKKDWNRHRMLCKSLETICQKMKCCKIFHESLKGISVAEWNKLRAHILLLCQFELNRPLYTDESQQIMFPRVCNICFEPRSECLKDCVKCKTVSYCSEEHRKEDEGRHERDCASLKLCFELDNDRNRFIDIFSIALPCPSVSGLQGASFLVALRSSISTPPEGRKSLEDIVRSDLLTCPMTIVYSLFMLGCTWKESLTVEVVGAAAFETSYLPWWRYIFHWLIHLKAIHIILVGPELSESSVVDIKCCTSCIARNVNMHVEFQSGMLYRDYKKNCNVQPDLVVAFNCGFSEYQGTSLDSWIDSIPCMLSQGCPILITSYTADEAQADLKQLLSMDKNIDIVVSSEENMFASQRPHRNWAVEHDSSSQIFYKNNFLSIVKTDRI